MNTRTMILAASALLAASGCDRRIAPLLPGPEAPPPPFECDPARAPEAPESLQWKRTAALAADLSIALELSESELCRELDVIACREVHGVALGSNDPFGAARYEAVVSPLATTPTALDRVVISACENAALRDAGGSPRVFTDLPPTDVPLDPSDPAIAAQLTALYRRLVMRDPEPAEVAIVGELATTGAGAPRTAREFDVLACFAIGTTTEALSF